MKNKLIVFCYSNHSCLNYHFWLRSARNFILVPRALSYQPGRRLPETCVVRDKGCHPIPKGRYVGEKKKKKRDRRLFLNQLRNIVEPLITNTSLNRLFCLSRRCHTSYISYLPKYGHLNNVSKWLWFSVARKKKVRLYLDLGSNTLSSVLYSLSNAQKLFKKFTI